MFLCTRPQAVVTLVLLETTPRLILGSHGTWTEADYFALHATTALCDMSGTGIDTKGKTMSDSEWQPVARNQYLSALHKTPRRPRFELGIDFSALHDKQL